MQDTLRLGQNSIFYEVRGEGDPIVWIHGGGVDHRMWKPQLDFFSQENKVISYDIRGHGQSDYVDNDQYDIADLASLLDHLEADSVHLVGLSFGTVLAIDFVLTYPNRVKKLVLLSPVLADLQSKEESYLKPITKIVESLEANDLDATLSIVDEMTFFGHGRETLPNLDAARAYVREATRVYFTSGNYQRIPQLKEPQPSRQLRSISSPTLIIHGLKDLAYISKHAKILKEEIPNSRRVEFLEAAHLVNIEKEKAVNQEIKSFLK